MKMKIPRIYDLGCNNKAKVIEYNYDRRQYLISYETVIAVCIRKKNGDKKVFRCCGAPLSSTTNRHWNAFCDYIGYPSGAKCFEETKFVQPVE